jgi:hypothetical protein
MLKPRNHHRLPAALDLVTKSSIIAAAALSALVLGVTASEGSATVGTQATSACSNRSYNLGKFTGIATFRFVLKRNVSCSQAHRTESEYVRALVAGRCRSRICTAVTFPGGWRCSSSSSAEEHEGAPAGGCSGRHGASFVVYLVRSRAAHASFHTEGSDGKGTVRG